jgi:hypothetical protein
MKHTNKKSKPAFDAKKNRQAAGTTDAADAARQKQLKQAARWAATGGEESLALLAAEVNGNGTPRP